MLCLVYLIHTKTFRHVVTWPGLTKSSHHHSEKQKKDKWKDCFYTTISTIKALKHKIYVRRGRMWMKLLISSYSVVLVSSLVTRAVCRMPSRFCSHKSQRASVNTWDNHRKTTCTVETIQNTDRWWKHLAINWHFAICRYDDIIVWMSLCYVVYV